MPHVIVKLWPGKSEQQKTRLAAAITKDVMDVLQDNDESVSVAFEEIKAQDWVEIVYKPDINDKWDKLYKKPGYNKTTYKVPKRFRAVTIACLALLPGLEKYAKDPITELFRSQQWLKFSIASLMFAFVAFCAEGTCFESPEFTR